LLIECKSNDLNDNVNRLVLKLASWRQGHFIRAIGLQRYAQNHCNIETQLDLSINFGMPRNLCQFRNTSIIIEPNKTVITTYSIHKNPLISGYIRKQNLELLRTVHFNPKRRWKNHCFTDNTILDHSGWVQKVVVMECYFLLATM
jgi:hypothetical protein